MANHKSAIKRIRSNEVKRLRNKYYYKTMRNLFKLFLKTTIKDDLLVLRSKIVSSIDKLAKTSVIHSNKAARYKSKVDLHFFSNNN